MQREEELIHSLEDLLGDIVVIHQFGFQEDVVEEFSDEVIAEFLVVFLLVLQFLAVFHGFGLAEEGQERAHAVLGLPEGGDLGDLEGGLEALVEGLEELEEVLDGEGVAHLPGVTGFQSVEEDVEEFVLFVEFLDDLVAGVAA